MSHHRLLKHLVLGLSCVGLALNHAVAIAASPEDASGGSPTAAVSDIELDATGHLWGILVDIQGVPVAKGEVLVSQNGRDLGSARTDGLGRFCFGPLRGGVYQLQAGTQRNLVRAWMARTAPPVAQKMALVVLADEVVRGQMPAEQFFASDAVVLTGMVAAMIALPVAIHNSHGGGERRPASP